jgi:hypothetical protein
MTVPNFRAHIGESIQFIKSDGTVYELNSPPSRGVLDMTGWGKPNEQFDMITGPFQHGETPLGYRLSPRSITLTLVHAYCSRTELLNGRSTLLDQMGINNASPNSPVAGTLRWAYQVGNTYVTRDLKVFLRKGFGFAPLDGWQNWAVIESIEFYAPDPTIYDPAVKTTTINTFTATLTYPMTFPFTLGSHVGTATIAYTGTWETYPIIRATGPLATVEIVNATTGKKIELDYILSLGEYVDFDLNYGQKTVLNNFGMDVSGYVLDTSDLADFSIVHDPVVAGGNNVINVYTIAATTGSAVSLAYYNRYYGI